MLILQKINDKYYKNYKYLFNYSNIKFNIINQNILFNYLYNNKNICNIDFKNSLNTQIYINIINPNVIHRGFYFQNFIINKYIKKKLIITNYTSIVSNLLLKNKIINFDIILIYNKDISNDNNTYKYISQFKKINNNIILYSSYDLYIYKQFLINLKNNNEENNISIPKHKYDTISCHIGYILGLSLTSSYRMSLEIPNVISSIAMALKNIAKDGTLLLFWSIVNVNVPIIKKILGILSYGFKNIEIIDNDINQNLLIGVPEYYIKCEGYRDNITHKLINKLLDIAIESLDYIYVICDILDYYDDYTEQNPNHSLFYNNIDEGESDEDNDNESKTSSNKKHTRKTKKSSSSSSYSSQSSSSSSSKPITPIYYIEDINIPELDEIMKDSSLEFEVSLLMNKLEGIFVGYFKMVNNLIVNAITYDDDGVMIVKEEAIIQKDITNLTKLITMFEYNKLPYNKQDRQSVM